MHSTLSNAIVAFVPATVLFAYSVAVFTNRRSLPTVVQLAGSVCLMVVVLTHVCEALRLFPAMGFGEPHSAGHYLDLSSAALGVTLLLIGFVLRAIGAVRRSK